jgi:hypothetical protein
MAIVSGDTTLVYIQATKHNEPPSFDQEIIITINKNTSASFKLDSGTACLSDLTISGSWVRRYFSQGNPNDTININFARDASRMISGTTAFTLISNTDTLRFTNGKFKMYYY